MPQPVNRPLQFLWWPVLVFLGVGIVWFMTPYVIATVLVASGSSASITHAGQFGDQFGAVSALFSGLAFAGVVVNLWLQRETTSAHQILARNQMKLLGDAIMAQTEVASSAAQASQGQAFAIAAGIIQADKVRLARKLTFKLLREKDFVLWSTTERAQAEVVCYTFDQIGIMIKNGMVKPQTIYDGWYSTVIESWKILEPFIRSKRKEYGSENVGSGFRYLFDEMRKIRKAEADRLGNYQKYPTPNS